MAEWGVDGWILERRLGAGALGEVWQAIRRQGEWQERAAIKFLSPGDTIHVDDDLERRFALEARIGARLWHPHVRRVMGHGYTRTGVPYLVMELLDGVTLQDHLERQGPLPLPIVYALLRQVGAALDAAHAVGVVHRDVKPLNIFVLDRAPVRFKLFDFGSAKLHGEQPRPGERRTDPDVVIGSPAYLSPEAINEPSRNDRRSDLWSLGVTTYRCLTGELPFNGKGLVDICASILSGQMASAERHRRDLPDGTDRWFARVFAHDIDKRPGSGEELAESFRALCGLPRPVSAERARRPLPRRGLAIAVAATVAISGVGLAASQRPSAKAPTPSSNAGENRAAPSEPSSASPPEDEPPPVPESPVPTATALPTAPPVIPSASAPPVGEQPRISRVTVDGGPTDLGCRGPDCRSAEGPPRRRFVPTFTIDTHEVTVADYAVCVRAGRCSADGLDRLTTRDGGIVGSTYCNWGHAARQQHPINCVTATQAQAYCAWAGGALPLATQWEKAARGPDGRRFPWAGELRANCGLTVMHEGAPGCRAESSWPVGHKPKDLSAYGLYDMAGNVSEWVLDPHAPPGHQQVRGGSWGMNDSPGMRPTRWHWAGVDSRSVHVGFRCVGR